VIAATSRRCHRANLGAGAPRRPRNSTQGTLIGPAFRRSRRAGESHDSKHSVSDGLLGVRAACARPGAGHGPCAPRRAHGAARVPDAVDHRRRRAVGATQPALGLRRRRGAGSSTNWRRPRSPHARAGITTRVCLLEGDPSEEILRHARIAKTELLVIGDPWAAGTCYDGSSVPWRRAWSRRRRVPF
jgi:hypothetical protein